MANAFAEIQAEAAELADFLIESEGLLKDDAIAVLNAALDKEIDNLVSANPFNLNIAEIGRQAIANIRQALEQSAKCQKAGRLN